MQNATQYAPCPNCGQTNAKKVTFTWWGGALGPALFTHVKCQNCQTEYNGKTGQSNRNNLILYSVASFVILLCVCGSFAALSVILGSQ